MSFYKNSYWLLPNEVYCPRKYKAVGNESERRKSQDLFAVGSAFTRDILPVPRSDEKSALVNPLFEPESRFSATGELDAQKEFFIATRINHGQLEQWLW